MAAIGEQSLRWFATDRAVPDDFVEPAAPDLPALVATLVSDHSPLLYRVALSIVRNPAEAEDIVQEVFLRVLQKQRQLAGLVEPRAWLVRIAWNLALDRRRRIRPDQMDDTFAAALASATLPADQALAETRRVAQVFTAIERLPKHEREALVLSAMEELSTAEIATILGKTESGVRALLFRARTRLRGRLGENS